MTTVLPSLAMNQMQRKASPSSEALRQVEYNSGSQTGVMPPLKKLWRGALTLKMLKTTAIHHPSAQRSIHASGYTSGYMFLKKYLSIFFSCLRAIALIRVHVALPQTT